MWWGFSLSKDFIHYIPKSALAVLVIFIGISLINKHAIKLCVKSTGSDKIVFFATILVGFFVALDAAIYAGMVISVILFLRKAALPEMIEYDMDEKGQLAVIEKPEERTHSKVSIVHVGGNLFFGASEVFRDQIRRACEDPDLKIIILKMRNAYNIDATSIMALEELVKFMNERGLYLIISEARPELVRVLLKMSNVYDYIGKEFVFHDCPENNVLSTAKAVKKAQRLLGSKQADVQIFVDKSQEKNQES